MSVKPEERGKCPRCGREGVTDRHLRPGSFVPCWEPDKPDDRQKCCATCAQWKRLKSATSDPVSIGTCPVHGLTGQTSLCRSYEPVLIGGHDEQAGSTYCPFCGGLGADHHVNCGLHTNAEQAGDK